MGEGCSFECWDCPWADECLQQELDDIEFLMEENEDEPIPYY